MAATVTIDTRANTNHSISSHQARGLEIVFGTITFDSEYATGGESVTFPGVATAGIAAVFIQNKSGYSFEFDKTNSKALAYYCELSAGTDGVQIQVASSVDLSAVTADFMLLGY
jgi:hypothetical protein